MKLLSRAFYWLAHFFARLSERCEKMGYMIPLIHQGLQRKRELDRLAWEKYGKPFSELDEKRQSILETGLDQRSG